MELAELDRAWTDPSIGIVTIVARGGMGKTSLVKRWLELPESAHGPRRIYGYSFYRRNTMKLIDSADEFIQGALRWFGDRHPHQGTPQEKGLRLAELIRAEPTLLILDGLEPLQFPPGVAKRGEITDEALRTLLIELATSMNGLCVATTRIALMDLKQFEPARVCRMDLQPLSRESGGKLLAALGVTGEVADLQRASQEVGGDSLALTLLGTYLSTAWGGRVEYRHKIDFATHDKNLRGHARKVMAAYEEWFAERPQLSAVMRILGLFDRPAPADAVAAVVKREEAPFPGLTEHLVELPEDEYHKVLTSLREIKLLYEEDPSEPSELDTHPMIREFFGLLLEQNSPGAWREGHSRLFDYFRNSVAEFPSTLEELSLLYLAVAHGCEAGRHQEALDEVYWRRIAKETAFVSTRTFGAVGADLTALSGFFQKPWSRPVATITESDRAFVLGQAAFNLWALGRLSEMLTPQLAALKVSVRQQDWVNASSSALNLCDYYVTTAEFGKALEYADESVRLVQLVDSTTEVGAKRYAQQSISLQAAGEDGFLSAIMHASRGDILHHMGRLDEATASFERAEILQRELQPAYPMLYSLPGFWFMDLLLRLKQYRQVVERARTTLGWIEPSGADLLGVALTYLVLAQAEHLGSGGKIVSEPSQCLERAVSLLEASGHMDYLPHGLLGRAELRRSTGDLAAAQADLDAVFAIAKRATMRIHEIDCHIGYWRLYRDRGDLLLAERSRNWAAALILETGYGRRVPVPEGDEFVMPDLK
jgi:tetratricopeptide (TPR) repeat protein